MLVQTVKGKTLILGGKSYPSETKLQVSHEIGLQLIKAGQAICLEEEAPALFPPFPLMKAFKRPQLLRCLAKLDCTVSLKFSNQQAYEHLIEAYKKDPETSLRVANAILQHG